MDHGVTETRAQGTRCRPSDPETSGSRDIVSPSLRGEEKGMKKKRHPLPMVAPRHRMVVAADVWLKKAGTGDTMRHCVPFPPTKAKK